MTTRREILQWAAALAALPSVARAAGAIESSPKPLDILFLGGTGFLGPHQVEYALARGHRVTLFNRGQSAAGLYGNRVETLIGNRDANVAPGLAALAGKRRWDIVIDNSGYVPRHVRDSVALLKDRADRYVFVSTVAAYDLAKGAEFDEGSPLRPLPDPPTEEVTSASYGALKAECDRIVRDALGAKATIVRPTYVVGPGDDTDRFTYWVEQVARGGAVLGPPDPDVELQWIDVRDLCPWIVQLGERNQPGIFNASGPSKPMRWREVLQGLIPLATRPVQFHWATREVLEKTGVRLPLVRSGSMGTSPSVHFDGTKAARAGLVYRPLGDTAAATLAWWQAQTPERRAKAEGWPSQEQLSRALEMLRTP